MHAHTSHFRSTNWQPEPKQFDDKRWFTRDVRWKFNEKVEWGTKKPMRGTRENCPSETIKFEGRIRLLSPPNLLHVREYCFHLFVFRWFPNGSRRGGSAQMFYALKRWKMERGKIRERKIARVCFDTPARFSIFFLSFFFFLLSCFSPQRNRSLAIACPSKDSPLVSPSATMINELVHSAEIFTLFPCFGTAYCALPLFVSLNSFSRFAGRNLGKSLARTIFGWKRIWRD